MDNSVKLVDVQASNFVAKQTGEANEDDLNLMQRLFCDEYLIDYNATRAYMAVYKPKNVNSAAASASRLLSRANIQIFLAKKSKSLLDEISKKVAKRESKLEITKERVILELARVAFFDVRKLFDDNGNGISITSLDDDTAAAISGIDISAIYKKDMTLDEKVAEVTKKFKTVNKGQALEVLARHFNIITNDNAINDDINVTFEDISQKNYANHIKGNSPVHPPESTERNNSAGSHPDSAND